VVESVNGGTDTVQTKLGSYTLDANLENLSFIGTGGFAGTGNAMANVIRGGGGADTLDGGSNTGVGDTLIGGAGDDIYIVQNSLDAVTEGFGGGTDTVRTALSTYTLGTNLENLTFTGSGSFAGVGNGLANVMIGGVGADNLNGAAGNDRLFGGGGADTLTGGAGSDEFVMVRGDANGDVITDFARSGVNGTDHITLSGYAAGAVLVHGAGTAYSVQVGGVTVDSFTVNGVAVLTAADYAFV
jgi:serralysin